MSHVIGAHEVEFPPEVQTRDASVGHVNAVSCCLSYSPLSYLPDSCCCTAIAHLRYLFTFYCAATPRQPIMFLERPVAMNAKYLDTCSPSPSLVVFPSAFGVKYPPSGHTYILFESPTRFWCIVFIAPSSSLPRTIHARSLCLSLTHITPERNLGVRVWVRGRH